MFDNRLPHVMFVVNDAAFFESHRMALAIGAREAGFVVSVVAPEGAAAERMRAKGVRIVPIANPRSGGALLSVLRLARDLFQVFRVDRPDVVHLITSKPVIVGGTLARLMDIPSIAAISGLGHVFTHGGLRFAVARWLVLNAYKLALDHARSLVIFQNATDRGIFEKACLGRRVRIEMIEGSGVDLAQFTVKPEPPGPVVAMLPARLLADKGVREFVAAADLLRTEGVTARFVLQGDIDLNNPTTIARAEIDEWVARGIVKWLGYSSDMPNAFAGAHVVVLPSYREGMPKSLLDAAAAGRAIIATDVPGCREAVEDGVTGILCKVRDPVSLAAAMKTLILNGETRRRMGKAARRRAEERYDVRQVVARHLPFYAELARKG